MDHLQTTKKEFRIQTGDTNYIYTNKLDKACFQHDMANVDLKDLARKTAFDKMFRYKAFNIAKNSKYDGYQKGLASMVYNFFDKNSAGSDVNMHGNNKIKQKQRSLDLAKHQLSKDT